MKKNFVRGLAKLNLGCNGPSQFALSYFIQKKFAKPRNHTENCKNVKISPKITLVLNTQIQRQNLYLP